jgi:general secretion pathway protein D
MLDSFAVRPGQVRADPVRNLLLIQGTGPERRNTMETALSFDVDWMRGQSVGIFPIQYSNPEPIIAELEKILDAGEGGLSQGNIKFQPMARMNGVLVVTKKPDLLKSTETWIKRLDKSSTNRTGVHVYRVNYGEARQVAKVLNDIFVGGGAGGAFDTPSSTAPRSASERLSLGSSQSGAAGGGAAGGGGLGGGGAGAGGRSASAAGFQSTLGTANGANANALEARSAGLGANSTAGGGAGGPLLDGVRITADASSNSLLIYASNENYEIILRTLAQLDRPQLQVAIDATIAEVKLNDSLQYGVQFFLQKGKAGLINSAGTTPLGVVTSTKNVNHSGIPLLDQLPAIGNVIGNTGHNITRTELIMFIRPQVIRDSIDAGQVAEELRTKLKGTLAPVPPYVGPAPRAR